MHLAVFVFILFESIKGLLTWREEDPSTRKIREGGKLFVCFTCRNFGQSGYQVEKEKNSNCRP